MLDRVGCGSNKDWAGLRFVNGYSPIRPAGVAREFASAIHGEVDPDLAQWFLQHQAGENGLLERIGIDGIIVAREFNFTPQPAAEWELATEADEGRVFSSPWPADPNGSFREFLWKKLDRENHGCRGGAKLRQCISCRSDGDRPALIAVSRPFFPGYRAQIDRRHLAVFSERSLIPLIDVPPERTVVSPFITGPIGSFTGARWQSFRPPFASSPLFSQSETLANE